MIVHDARNRPVAIGRRIGGGGEGDVFAVPGRARFVAKIYTAPTRESGEKLARMIDNPPSGRESADGHVNLAWPTELLYAGGDHTLPVGFLMPHVTGAVPLLEVFNPRLRTRTLPDFDRRYLFRTARNLAAVLTTLHQAGYVVGDINESNILVGPSALVSFIDCDSFQVQTTRMRRVLTYPCPVGKLEYTAPELQGKVFGREVRHPEADRFALGVLIFQLLMEGRHPFAGTWTGSGEPPSVEEKIRRGCFPYADHPTCPITPPPNALTLVTLPQDVAALMRRCFIDGHRQPSRRPAPEVWRDALIGGERSTGAKTPARRTTPSVPKAVESPDPRAATLERASHASARAAARKGRGAGVVAAPPAPQSKNMREVFATCVAAAVIFSVLAGGSWWFVQHADLPFSRAVVAPTPPDTTTPRVVVSTPAVGATAVAGASACTPATAAAAARRAAASASRVSYVPLAGSWVASATDLHTRFFGMPWWDELPALSSGTRYSVGTVPDGADDRLDIVRAPGYGTAPTVAAWQTEFDSYTRRSIVGESRYLNPATVTSAAVTGRPRAQQAAGYDGYLGQFHFVDTLGTQIDATMWVGQVGCDRVVMVFTGLPARDRQIDQAVAQVLSTVDFNAR